MTRFERLLQAMQEKGWNGIIVSSVHAVRYFAGMQTDLETGPNALEAGPPLLLITRSGEHLHGRLLAPQETDSSWIEYVTYENYNIETPGYDRYRAYRGALEVWASVISKSMKLAVEKGSVPYVLSDLFDARQSDDCTSILNEIRQIKDPDEIHSIRAAVQLANVGQKSVKAFARKNISEIELFGRVKSEIEKSAGQRIPLLADFVSGALTANVGGLPGGRSIASGELILADLVPCYNGYWGDSCTVTAVGRPTERMEEIRSRVEAVLRAAEAMIHPGCSVKELDAQVRESLKKYGYTFPHHTGHGIGVQYHEAPVIAPNGSAVLQENMVIALEPGVYLEEEGFGIRLEHVYLVTKDGYERLTDYTLNF